MGDPKSPKFLEPSVDDPIAEIQRQGVRKLLAEALKIKCVEEMDIHHSIILTAKVK